jgi:hypothetical protein
MKKFLFVALAASLFWACSSQKNITGHTGDPPKVVKDSTEYELIIIDPEFDIWYQLNFTLAKDHTNEYYSSKNLVGTINWNHYFTSGRNSQVVCSFIDYLPSIDYGIELNRKLYWYFRFIEETYRIRLLR